MSRHMDQTINSDIFTTHKINHWGPLIHEIRVAIRWPPVATRITHTTECKNLDLNLLTRFGASPIRLYTGPNENRVSPNIADLVSTRKLACSTSILNCRTYCGGSQVHNIGTSVGAKIVTQKSDYSVQLPLHSQTNSHATTYILSNTSVSKVICWF